LAGNAEFRDQETGITRIAVRIQGNRERNSDGVLGVRMGNPVGDSNWRECHLIKAGLSCGYCGRLAGNADFRGLETGIAKIAVGIQGNRERNSAGVLGARDGKNDKNMKF
jgi:hypothetical protein